MRGKDARAHVSHDVPYLEYQLGVMTDDLRSKIVIMRVIVRVTLKHFVLRNN
jgi:hypothetical protein